ncbi:hypothetical protein EHS39_07180 [Ensifer sp. MPMI2T]|nr:hypothetical protein EHS39_07180 [Ensifer sp. MPMI2T]
MDFMSGARALSWPPIRPAGHLLPARGAKETAANASPKSPLPACGERGLHDSLNRNRFKDKIMQQFKVLQRP